MDLVDFLRRQRRFSLKTFGPADRQLGIVAHIRAEPIEIEADPRDLIEWIDVVLLALDGARRTGASIEEICRALEAKLTRNENRKWPTGARPIP